MKHSVIEMTRAVRRRLERVVRKSREQDYARRALAVLHLWETQGNVTEAAHRVRAARSSVSRWQSLYETYGEDGIRAQARGRSDWKANEEVLSMLESLVREDPRELGYLRSRWSSQLLAMELESRSGVEVHATTVRRWLARLRFRYRRARPTTFRRDPRKAERLAASRRHWPRTTRIRKCSTPTRPTWTSIHESGRAGCAAASRARFRLRGRIRSTTSWSGPNITERPRWCLWSCSNSFVASIGGPGGSCSSSTTTASTRVE